MRILGLIVEYNPFHNGHIYHIHKAKELVHPDVTVAVMSSSFVQRGEPAIIDKWQRSTIAIENGIDIVIELPFVYSCQSADYFSQGALFLLNAIGVTDICFGSEEGHIDVFLDIAHTIKNNHETYNQYVKTYMKQGLRYPDATNQALEDIMHKQIRTPNDLLGLSYVKEIINNDYPIQPHCIARTNNYHDDTLHSISSATALRKAIYHHQDISNLLPHSELYEHYYTLEYYFPYLQYIISMSSKENLRNIHMVDEGLENTMKKVIMQVHNVEELVDKLSSKRYTKPRISRMLIHILMQNSKDDIKEAINLDYIRILAMNDNGRGYLSDYKKITPYPIITNISRYNHPALDIEVKATQLLALQSNKNLIKEEYAHIPYLNS
ncbi:MAG: nucleotidyltransferase [Erysipelotrichaceae bacterium]|nr:nucleotidyltransferase [Erysipelotrichaceae bacterium]